MQYVNEKTEEDIHKMHRNILLDVIGYEKKIIKKQQLMLAIFFLIDIISILLLVLVNFSII